MAAEQCQNNPRTHSALMDLNELRKKIFLLSIESLLFNKDPGIMVYYNPYITGYYNML